MVRAAAASGGEAAVSGCITTCDVSTIDNMLLGNLCEWGIMSATVNLQLLLHHLLNPTTARSPRAATHDVPTCNISDIPFKADGTSLDASSVAFHCTCSVCCSCLVNLAARHISAEWLRVITSCCCLFSYPDLCCCWHLWHGICNGHRAQV